MEQSIGRGLRDDEVVHHINGDITDNRLENLKIMSPTEHSKYHVENGDIHLEGNIATQNLTPREEDVYTLVKQGMTSAQIGDALGISRRTVEIHRQKLRRKFGIPALTQF
jgi:DNA-binding CsgD family transcriptional regulator